MYVYIYICMYVYTALTCKQSSHKGHESAIFADIGRSGSEYFTADEPASASASAGAGANSGG